LGIHILDILGRPVTRIPPKQDVDLIEEIRLTVAGTAAGTSVDLAKLGVNVVAMGAIGNDAAGQFILDTMGRYGIDTSRLRVKEGVQTSATMLPIRPSGERPALHVLGANAELTEADIDLDVIASADVLHLGGTYLMSKFDGEPSRRVLEHAKSNGVNECSAGPIERAARGTVKLRQRWVDWHPGVDDGRRTAAQTSRSAASGRDAR